MRILALVTDAYGAGGGIARYNQHLLSALSRSDAVSDVLVLPRFGCAAPDTPAKVRQLPPSPDRARWAARSIRLALQQRFDAVFCGHLNALPLAAALSRLRRAPLWAQVHGIEAWQPRGAAVRRSLAAAALVTSVSRYTRRRLLAWADIAPARVRVLPNTFDPVFAPQQPDSDLQLVPPLSSRPSVRAAGASAPSRDPGPQALRGSLTGPWVPDNRAGSGVVPHTRGLGPRGFRDDREGCGSQQTAEQPLAARLGLTGKRVILTVGRLSAAERYKGHDRIIRALPAVLRHVPDAVYLIVGSGNDQPRLDGLARQAGLVDRVVFAGQVADSDLPAVFALADAFAMPSTGEGFGIVFLEAAAAGLPVIGGNCDGSLDALADGVIGRPVDPDSGSEIAAALVDALAGRTVSQPAAVRRFAVQNFADHVDRLVRTLAR